MQPLCWWMSLNILEKSWNLWPSSRTCKTSPQEIAYNTWSTSTPEEGMDQSQGSWRNDNVLICKEFVYICTSNSIKSIWKRKIREFAFITELPGNNADGRGIVECFRCKKKTRSANVLNSLKHQPASSAHWQSMSFQHSAWIIKQFIITYWIIYSIHESYLRSFAYKSSA